MDRSGWRRCRGISQGRFLSLLPDLCKTRKFKNILNNYSLILKYSYDFLINYTAKFRLFGIKHPSTGKISNSDLATQICRFLSLLLDLCKTKKFRTF